MLLPHDGRVSGSRHAAEVVVRPYHGSAWLQGQGGSAVVAVSQSRDGSSASWLGVGLCGGHAALADPRTGELSAFWRAHEGALTCLAACSEHRIVTGSQVGGCGHVDVTCREVT